MSGWTRMRSNELSQTTSGRKDRLCGHTGVTMMAGVEGATMGPPALME